MTTSITTALGAGSGLDTKALVESLAAAVKAPREAVIAKRETQNSARISALGEISGAIDSFATALGNLIAGGTLYSQPSVSDPSVLSASALAGSRLGALSAQLRVEQLAQAQTMSSVGLAGASAPVGEGTLSLTIGTTTTDIVVDSTNNTLDGLAKAINAANTNVKASIVNDQGQAKLVLKGATGAANAFTLSVPSGTTSGLERFASGAMTPAQAAQDAIVVMDGVEVRRASNSFSDLIEGVQIDLKRAVPGQLVNLGVTRPTAAITQGVGDFVAAYNELQSMIATATAAAQTSGGDSGPLRGDTSIRELQRQLASLSSTVLNSGGGPRTLAEIGVATNRDGTLRVNSAQLAEALERDPDGVEALFNPSQYSSNPLVTITSKMGKVKPGTYQLTDLVPADGTNPMQGKVDGLTMIGSQTGLVAPSTSKALGLIVKVTGATASATITVDAGLGGALQAIRDAIRARGGPIATAQERFAKEAEAIADDRDKMETRHTVYYNQLLTNFTAMERRVSAFKATQSYLEQQIAAWNKDN